MSRIALGLGDRATRALRLLDPELAQSITLRALRTGRFTVAPAPADPRLAQDLLGLSFPNPIGLAAGFDRNGAATDALFGLGFGFVEIGTVTPLPEGGNPRPRLFRLAADGAMINRVGPENGGHDAAADLLDARTNRDGILGVNIGANRGSEDRLFDYFAGARLFGPMAAYITVNISGSSMPGLGGGERVTAILGAVERARAAAAEESGRRTPLLLKVEPDLGDAALADVIDIALGEDIGGLIIGNAAATRPRLKSKRYARQQGWLSGRPLFDRSTAMLARARQVAGPHLVLVGVGGVDGPGTAWSKIAAGADLVQLYTGLTYGGPSLPGRIVAGLLRRLEERNFKHIREVRGIENARWVAAWEG